MKYAIVNAEKAEKKGFNKMIHRMVTPSKMVLNENELRLIGDNIEDVASTLGGCIMSHAEVMNEINENR